MAENNTNNSGLMGILSLIMGVGGIFLHYVFILNFMDPVLAAETEAAQACGATAPYFLPIYADIGFLGGLFWILAGIGFLQKKKWAYPLAVIGVVLSLDSSFWPNIPAMESGSVFPVWFLVFLPNLVMYFLLLRSQGDESWKKALFGMLLGMAFILNSINGIASTTRMVTEPDHMFTLTQRLNFFASILFGIATIAIFIGKKSERTRIIALSGAILSIAGGFPLAIYSMFFWEAAAGFSMFMMAPVVSTVAGLFCLFPGLWKKVTASVE